MPNRLALKAGEDFQSTIREMINLPGWVSLFYYIERVGKTDIPVEEDNISRPL